MLTRWTRIVLVLGLVALPPSVVASAAKLDAPRVSRPETHPATPLAANAMPRYFEANQGQTDPCVRFLARARKYTAFLTEDAAVFRARRTADVVRMRFVSGRAAAVEGRARLRGKSHYFFGDDAARWVRDVAHFGEVWGTEVCSGVDVRWRFDGSGELRYDFVVAPGADASALAIRFEGAESVDVDAAGRLRVATAGGQFTHSRPVVFQETDAGRATVDGAFVLRDDGVGFALGAYDRSMPLVIDPEVSYSTYLGGTAEDRQGAVAVDGDGAAYFAGATASVDFPTASPVQAGHGGGLYDAVVAKLLPDGSGLAYATYLGGTADDEAYGVAVDGSGAAYVAGDTLSTDFPTQAPLQPAAGGNFSSDGFVAKLSPDGSSLAYSTYLGGEDLDRAFDIAVTGNGEACVVGTTLSTDFPTASPRQGAHASPLGSADAFVCKLAGDGSGFVYSTFHGGSQLDTASSVAVDGAGAAYVTGQTMSPDFPTASPIQGALGASPLEDSDAFVSKFAPDGSALAYSTYLGGSGLESGYGIDVDDTGAAHVIGLTQSFDFPTVSAFQPAQARGDECFVTKLDVAGSALVYSTYLGGTGPEFGFGIAVDGQGRAWVYGWTASGDFPTQDPLQIGSPAVPDVFLTQFTVDGTGLGFSTLLGGSGRDDANIGRSIAIGADDAVYVIGNTDSGDFPTVAPYQAANAGGQDGFLVKFGGDAPEPPPDGNEPPPGTIRSFLLPKKVRVVVGGGKKKPKPGVKVKAFFDTGPDEWDAALPATLTIGPREIQVPGLSSSANGKFRFFENDQVKLKVKPSPFGSSKAKFKLKFSDDLAGEVDLDGPFTIRYEGGGADAEGTVRLDGGSFTFGRAPGTLIAPPIDIRKVKARLPAPGRHSFKFVAGLAGDGTTPAELPDVTVSFGEAFSETVAKDGLVPRGRNFRLPGAVGGLSRLVVSPHKERISAKGVRTDVGDFAVGPVPLLLVVTMGADERAVLVRAVFDGTRLRY